MVAVDDVEGRCQVTWTGNAHLDGAPVHSDGVRTAAGTIGAHLGAGQASGAVAALTAWIGTDR
jgi:hypothetical protein